MNIDQLTTAIQWVTIFAMWIMTYRLAKTRQWYRTQVRQNEHQKHFGHMTQSQVVDATGLSDLQVRVAMDAALAMFEQRIRELQRSSRG